MTQHTHHEQFVKKYTLAHRLEWSRQNFAQFLGMTTDSVRRKVGKIRDSIGLELPPLQLSSKPLTKEMVKEFNDALKQSDIVEFGEVKQSRKYLITSAQNATPVHAGFLSACLNYCKATGAEFLVIPYRYKNPTSVWSKIEKQDEWWASNIEPYLIQNKTMLCDNLTLLANVKIQPTASENLKY
jgi:hypothetical protein